MNPEQRWVPGALAGICATFMGTVVGAGFASGREIYQFFSRYGGYGFAGMILAFLVMGWAGMKVYRFGYCVKPRSYQELLQFLLGPRLTGLADLLLSLFFLLLIAVMFAGSGAIFATLHINHWYGILITAVFLVGILWKEFSGIIAINLLVIPLMFLGALLVAGNAIVNHPELLENGALISRNPRPPEPWLLIKGLIAATQFAAYNLILAVPVLLSLAKRYPFPRILKLGGWMGCLGLGLMTAVIHWALLSHLSVLQDCPLPMVELAKGLGVWGYFGYALILWGEMLTTLLANTYGLAVRLNSLTRWPFRLWVIVLTLGGMAMAQVGFTRLIARVYPAYGFLCFILIVLLFLKVKGADPRPGTKETVWKWK